MDIEATQAAYQSLDLPSSDVTFTWNDEGTVLEIVSDNFLQYARGEGTTFAAKRYTFSLSGAKDANGNDLATFSSSFSTLRALSNMCLGIADLEGLVQIDGAVDLNGAVIEVDDSSKQWHTRFF